MWDGDTLPRCSKNEVMIMYLIDEAETGILHLCRVSSDKYIYMIT